MGSELILASTSSTRAGMLSEAGLVFSAVPSRVDEESLRASLVAEGANGRSLADVLAEQKATKVSARYPGALVLGSDQVLEYEGRIFTKPETLQGVRDQLLLLRGGTHRLISAAVLVKDARPLWRDMEEVRLSMRDFSDTYLDAYLARHWPGLRDTVGGYKLEEEGVRLFSRIEGSYFAVLGLPLLPLLNQLTVMGEIPA